MKTTYIIGHKKPDTDSVVAAIALEYLYQQKSGFEYKKPKAVISDPVNPETKFLLDKFKVKAPPVIKASDIKPDDQVVLVDHNEESQRLDNLNPDQIVDIIDHHKANLNLGKPIYMTFKTWGSSATIVYYTMKQVNVKPDKTLAALLLGAIISDTVGFKSATTDEKDIKLGKELAQIANINDLDDFALQLFRAKSNVMSLTDEQIVRNDYKIYDFAQKVYIAQIETVEQTKLIKQKKQNLLQAMKKVKNQEKVDLLYVVITDVLKVNSKVLVLNTQEQKILEQAFKQCNVKNRIMDIGARMSRKKQIAPEIEKIVNES